jgi:hypothetical protein
MFKLDQARESCGSLTRQVFVAKVFGEREETLAKHAKLAKEEKRNSVRVFSRSNAEMESADVTQWCSGAASDATGLVGGCKHETSENIELSVPSHAMRGRVREGAHPRQPRSLKNIEARNECLGFLNLKWRTPVCPLPNLPP